MKKALMSLGLGLVASMTVAAGPVSAGGGNSDAAKACQKGGSEGVVRQDGTPFRNAGDCARYVARGGVLTSPIPAGCYTDGVDSIAWPGGLGPETVDAFEGTDCSGQVFRLYVVLGTDQEDAGARCENPANTIPFGVGAYVNGYQFFLC